MHPRSQQRVGWELYVTPRHPTRVISTSDPMAKRAARCLSGLVGDNVFEAQGRPIFRAAPEEYGELAVNRMSNAVVHQKRSGPI